MSVDGFVASLEARLEKLNEEMSAIIKRDGGSKITSHLRSQLAETQKIREALYKARRPGISA